MAHDAEVQKSVRAYYVFDRLSLEKAAEKAGVAFGTARRWKAQAEQAGDNWEKARDVHVMASGGIEHIAQGLLAGFLIKYRTLMTELEENSEMATADKVEALSALADSFGEYFCDVTLRTRLFFLLPNLPYPSLLKRGFIVNLKQV